MQASPYHTRVAILGASGLMIAMAPLAWSQNAATPPAPNSLRALSIAPLPDEKTADGTPVPQSITTPSGKQLKLTFHDEFDAVPDTKDGQPYIDRRKWQTTFWQGSSVRTLGSNAEAQYYMDKDYAGRDNLAKEKRPNPFSFDKPGILTISAWKTPRELWGNYWMGEQRPFSSGLLISDKRFVFKYGYIEGRFKLPNTRGSWPAFWTLCNNPSRSTDPAKQRPWPPEIDIFEYFGHRPTKFTTGAHVPKSEKLRLSSYMHDAQVDLSQDFHTWAVDWDEKNVVYYLDGKEVARGECTDSFRQPMYLLINLAVGGNWYSEEMKAAKTPAKAWEVDETTMPWKMECDYVRVYQSDADIALAAAPLPEPPAPPKGPTPYPAANNEAAWPGKGPIRSFGWMVDNRNAFWQNREKDQGAVVFVGDSLIGGWKGELLKQSFPNLKIANRGIGGDVSRGTLFRFKEDVLDLKPRAIVICTGTNDLSTHADPALAEHNIKLMIEQARAQNPKVPIVLCQLPPRDVANAPIKPGAMADINARIAKLAEGQENMAVVDLFTSMATPEGKPIAEFFGTDLIHPTSLAYQKWGEIIRPVLAGLGVQ